MPKSCKSISKWSNSTSPADLSLQTHIHSGFTPKARYSCTQSFKVCLIRCKLGTAKIIFFASNASAIQKAAKLLPVPQGMMSLPLVFFLTLKCVTAFFIAGFWCDLGFLFLSLICLLAQRDWILSQSWSVKFNQVSRPISVKFFKYFLLRTGFEVVWATTAKLIFFAVTKLKVVKVESSS